MLRKIAIGLAAVAIATGGATLSASAMRGGGGGHGGGGMHGGMHGGMVGGFHGGSGRYAMAGRYRHDHWRGRGGYGGYSYGGSCWRDGVWVCPGGGYYGPSYYRYGGYYRGGRGFRGGRSFGMHGGGGHGGRR
jgi:hypothetical protein